MEIVAAIRWARLNAALGERIQIGIAFVQWIRDGEQRSLAGTAADVFRDC